MSRVTPPLMDLRVRDRQLSKGWAERILSPYLCVRVDSDEAILQGGVTTLNACGVLQSFFLPLETQLKAITRAASSITSRNKHCNHILHPSTNFLGTK